MDDSDWRMKKRILRLAVIVAAVITFFWVENVLAHRAMNSVFQEQQASLLASSTKAINWHSYEERLLKIDVSGCPADFRQSWTIYIQAVHATAGMQGMNLNDVLSVASPKRVMFEIIDKQGAFRKAEQKIKEAKLQLVSIAQRHGASVPSSLHPGLAGF
jgi:hypothetical protein